MTVLALALAVLCTAIVLYLMYRAPDDEMPPQARTEPRDPVREEVDRWMHQWVRGRA